jgi:hypothetical protein
MAVARTNPLAPGVYWIDVWAPSRGSPKTPNGRLVMQQWEDANAFTVIATKEEFTDGVLKPPAEGGRPFRYFYKFQVLKAPTPFPFAQLGFPTIRKLAPPEQITAADTAFKSDDTVTKPPPEPMFDFGAVLGDAGPWLILGALFLLTQKGNK